MGDKNIKFKVRNNSAMPIQTLQITARSAGVYMPILTEKMDPGSSTTVQMTVDDAMRNHSINLKFSNLPTIYNFNFPWTWKSTDFSDTNWVEITVESQRFVFLFVDNDTLKKGRWIDYNFLTGTFNKIKSARSGEPSSAGDMVPGSTSILGWGFNIFGEYSATSKLRQLLDFTKSGAHPEIVNGAQYMVPNSVSAGESHDFSGSATFFSSKEEVSKYFSAKAGISGGYAGFKGSLKAGYTSDELNTTEFNYCIFDGQKLSYPLNINNPDISLLADSVLADADYHAMAAAAATGFDKNNPTPFYNFFLKYGTHFVYEVEMGGSLYYYAAVNKSYSKSSQDISVKASFEYNGLFNAEAKAKADWNNLDEKWVQNRQMQLVITGGSVNFPSTSDVAFGTNMNDAYNQWLADVDTNPSPMGFKLYPMSALFSGSQAAAINDALEHFIAGQISISLERNQAMVAINGESIDTSMYQSVMTKEPSGNFVRMFSYLALVVDRITGKVVDTVSVLSESGWTWLYNNGETNPAPPTASATVPPQLSKYEGKEQYLLIFMWYGENDGYMRVISVAPAVPLRTLLTSTGAGPLLDNWHNSNVMGDPKCPNYNVYILVGIFGLQGQGFETMATASLTDTAASASMTLSFIPQMVDGVIMYTPA